MPLHFSQRIRLACGFVHRPGVQDSGEEITPELATGTDVSRKRAQKR